MEILTYKKVYQLVGDSASGTNECITKSAAVEIAQAHRKNITSNLSQYLNNEYIDVFAVEDKPDLSTFSFANNRYNPQAAGNTYITSVSSRDIDGNTITYDATSDVDWITDIVINGTEIKFTVNANIGDQRTGHITGSNATGRSDTITIVQEAKQADMDYTYTLVATCDSVPTVTINGTSITRYTTSGNDYTFQYTVRVRTEDEAPQSVDFTIDGGGVGESYDRGTLSLLPSSWDLNEGLSNQFTVSYSRVKTTKTWDNASGTISRDGSVNVALNSSDTTEYPTIDYTISDTHVSGQSFSHSKNGMQFTSAASSINCTGTISVQYNGLTATSMVGYTEEFPDDIEHRWIDVSPTQLTFTADGGSVDITGTYGLTGTLGTRKEIGSISDTITVDANPSTSSRSGSKTYYYNNDSSQTPTSEVTWTQDGREEVFTYKYFIKIGYNLGALSDRIQLVWQNDQYSQSSKKTFYVRSYKYKINERGEIVATEQTKYSLRYNSSGNDNFSISNHNITTGLGQVDCFPIEENTSYQLQKTICFQVYNEEDSTVFCSINLIQEKKGIQIISGDAVMFTYNWDKGTDLDQATFVNLNLPASNYRNYAGYFGRIINEYRKILYFAGDNTGTGNEYSFIDFKQISKYLSEHGNEQSPIDGKTILESLTDDNGAIKIQCDLYTNWYNKKEQENITLLYSIYNKDSEDATITTNNKQFILNGYTKINDSSDQALCYASGSQNVLNYVNVKDGYTLSAKFVYYFNSEVFAFETNKDNVGKWHKGTNFSAVRSEASYSNEQFTKDDNNINFSISIDSVNEPDYFDKNNKVIFNAYIHQNRTSNYYFIGQYITTINQLPYKLESSVPLSNVIKDMDFGENDTVEIYPRISFISSIINYSEEKYLDINDIALGQNVLTLQKQNT